MNTRLFSGLILIMLLVSLSGCAKYATKKRINSIETAITNYGVSIRWALYKEAYDYHVSPDGTKPPFDLDALENLSVTKVNVTNKTINEETTEAIVNTDIHYYFQDQVTIKTLKLEQRWWGNKENNQWFIDGAFPEFK